MYFVFDSDKQMYEPETWAGKKTKGFLQVGRQRAFHLINYHRFRNSVRSST